MPIFEVAVPSLPRDIDVPLVNLSLAEIESVTGLYRMLSTGVDAR